MTYLRFFLLFFLLPLNMMAQQNDEPSIEQLISDYEEASSSQKKNLATKIIQRLIEEDVFYTPPSPVRPDMPSDTLDALVYYGAHCHAFCHNDFSRCITFGEKAIPLLQGKHPSLYTNVLSNIARLYQVKGERPQALEWAEKTVKACKESGDDRELSRVYTTLSYIYVSLHKGELALDYALEAIDASHRSGDTLLIHNLYNAVCDSYAEKGDYQESIKYGKLAVNAAKNRGSRPSIIASHLSLLGYAYYKADDINAASKVLDEAFQLIEQDTISVQSMAPYQYKAMVLFKQNRVDEAVQYLHKAIEMAKERGNLRDECNIQFTLYQSLREINPTEALKALERHTELRDTIYNEELQQSISEAEASFHNEQLKKDKETAENRNRLILITSIIVALLLIGIIGMLFYAMRTRARSVKAMRRLQNARERFFTNVTHEFRTPLTVILGVANRMKKSALLSGEGGNEETAEKVEQKRSLELIERNGQQLLTLVNQLLDVAKATSAIGDLEYLKGNLVAYTDMVVESLQEPANLKGIQLTFQPKETELHTAFVADYMQKILSNLVTNAIKFTPSGGKVTIGMKKEGGYVRLTVSDTGQGIQEDDLPHIFEPFFQGDNSQMGTGVGLSLVKQLVEAMEGTISVESTYGEGATFIVEMPIKEVRTKSQQAIALDQQDTKEEDVIHDEIAQSSEERDAQEKDIVLVVEDNTDVAEYIGSVLSDKYEVQYATNGAEGIERANKLMPDLIVTDVMMPDVDGLELCRRIRASEMTNHIPLVIITARVTDEDRMQGIKAGADAYLYKPFLADELLLRIEKLLESRQMLQKKFSATISDTPQQEMPSEPQTLYERNVMKANEEFLQLTNKAISKLMPTGDCSALKVAEELCMSRSQFARKLKAVIDTTPSDYIVNYRLNEVKRLLKQQPPLPFLDIALKCGFADNAHMTHVFKQKLGITPSQYIKETN